MSLGGVPVRINSNKDKLAGITVVVQERERETSEESRVGEEIEQSLD